MANRRVRAVAALVAVFVVAAGGVVAAWRLHRELGVSLTAAGVAAVPSGLLATGTVLLYRSDVVEERYDAVLAPTVLGAVAFTAVLFVAFPYLDRSVVDQNSSLLFMAGVGAMAGFLAGVERARRIEQAERAEAAEVTAQLATEEHERMQVLNRTSRALTRATTLEDVASVLVSEGWMGLPGSFTGVWRYDEATGHLVPVAAESATQVDVGHVRSGTEAMATFESGDRATIPTERGLPDLRTLVATPIAGELVLVVGSDRELGENARRLVEVYVRTAESAVQAVVREQEVRDQREATDRLLNAVPDVFFTLNENGELIRWNDRLLEVSGYDETVVDGKPAVEFLAAEDREPTIAAIQQVFEEGRVVGHEATVETATGEHIPYEFSARRVRLPTEGTVGIAGTGRDVTERLRREAELERKNDRLEAFASTVAHDLRNPLNVIRGNADLTRETEDLSRLDIIEAAAERMEDIIDDILDLARAGESALDDTPVDVEPIVRTAWGVVETDGSTLAVADQLPTLEGDADRLARLFENLFRNAVEHGDGSVTVEVGSLDGSLGFYVQDDGPGIPPAERDSVLEEGYTTSDGGTGFGLAIVSDIAAAHDLSVSVTEGTEGGARFEFVREQGP